MKLKIKKKKIKMMIQSIEKQKRNKRIIKDIINNLYL